MTSQGSPYARFRRALDSRNATVAVATATELEFVSLLLLILESEPSRFERAALRWPGRYCREVATSLRPKPCSPASPRFVEDDRNRPLTRSPI